MAATRPRRGAQPTSPTAVRRMRQQFDFVRLTHSRIDAGGRRRRPTLHGGLSVSEHDAHLNDFATRSFRDVADQDYVMARAAYRARLYPQFHWSGLQAIEKYLKAILLYNRIPQPQGKHRLGHDLRRALELTKQLPFELSLSDPSREIIKHLDTFGRFRYLETSYYLRDRELLKLDRAVWELRLYCRAMNYALKLPNGKRIEMLSMNLREIELVRADSRRKFRIQSGVLEKILSKKDHPARPSLAWKNLFFNNHNRKTIQWRNTNHMVNAPLALEPRFLEEVRKYVWLPGEVVATYRDEIQKRAKGG